MRIWGYIIFVLGLILGALSIIADAAQIGGTVGIGFAQIGGLVLGLLMIVGGAYLIVRSESAHVH